MAKTGKEDSAASQPDSSQPDNKKTTKANTSPRENNTIRLAKIKMWQTIIIAIITTIGGGIFGYIGGIKKTKDAAVKDAAVSVPINNTVNLVETLPVETNADDYMLLKDISIFDLRQWKPTPDSLMNTRYSPANYTNYLHVKKTKLLNKIVIHYATSGYGIDMRCITHPFEVQQLKTPVDHHGEHHVKEYAMTIDVSSSADIGKEFLIVVEATYWNGFNNLKQENASTYTDDEIHGMNELGLIVFFPDKKPFVQATKLDTDTKTGKSEAFRGLENYYEDLPNKKFIYWDIRERSANHHYKLQWTW